MAETSRQFQFANARGETLAGRLELPDGRPRAVALFAHCFTCSKDIAAASRISRGLRREGLGVLRFDFTGLGNSEGDFGNTDFTSNVEDLVAAAERLKEERLAPSILVGHSLGGAAVLAAASRISGIRAVVTIGAPSDPAHVAHLLDDEDIETIRRQGRATVTLGGRPFPISAGFLEDITTQKLESALRQLDAALLIFHSPLDDIVGIDHARTLYEAARHPKSFVSLDDADHLLSRAQDSAFVAAMLAAWSARYVEDAEAPGPAKQPGDGASGDTKETPAGALDPGTVTVDEAGTAYGNRVRAGKHELRADEPASVGGQDTGPTPYDLLLAALGTCTSMTLRMYADHKQWPLQHVGVTLSHDRIHAQDCAECETQSGKIDRIQRELRLVGNLSAEQRERLREIADRCPVHRTLVGEKQISTRLADD